MSSGSQLHGSHRDFAYQIHKVDQALDLVFSKDEELKWSGLSRGEFTVACMQRFSQVPFSQPNAHTLSQPSNTKI
jgi:hypothetical protein